MNGFSNHDERPVIDRHAQGDERPTIARAASGQTASAGVSATQNVKAKQAAGGGDAPTIQNRRRSRKYLPIIGIAAILLLLLIFFVTSDAPVQEFAKKLDEGNYSAAAAIYNSKIAGNRGREEKVYPGFESAVLFIQESFGGGSMSYDSAISALTALGSIQNAEAAEKANEARTDVTNLHNGHVRSKSAHYADAIGLYLQISPERKLYAIACDHIDLCAGKLLDAAERNTDEALLQELLVAVSLLREHPAFGGHVREAEGSVIRLTVANAQNLAQNDDYQKALSIIRSSMNVLPDHEELDALLSDFHQRYEQFVSAQINGLIADNDFASAVELLSQVQQSELGDDVFLTLQELIAEKQSAYIQQIRDRIHSCLQKEDYPAAFGLLEQIRKADSANAVYPELEKTVMDAYENSVSSRVQKLVESNRYADALSLLTQLLEEHPDNVRFRELVVTVTEAKDAYVQMMGEFTNQDVDFIQYEGSISKDGQIDEYVLNTTVSGHYRIYMNNLVSGFSVNISVYDNADGSRLDSTSYGCGNGGGLTLKLDENKSYTIKVREYSGTGNYQLVIGQPKPVADISLRNHVYDSIQYADQRNWYRFTPEVSGHYRFELTNMVNGFTVNMYIYDELGYVVDNSTYGLSIQDGLTVSLEANKTYDIAVREYSSEGTYALAIGKQKPTATLQEDVALSDEITFTGQRNCYTFTPAKTGTYVFSLGDMRSSVSVNLYVIDSLDYTLESSTYGLSGGDVIKVKLTAGQTYTIKVRQYKNSGSYTLTAYYQSS